ncbi:MAG TPA: tyrosine--tRNA ligase [Candidatus Paceibacterota bacterium]|nr:tyrosine--tRNA ligase [Candidatus Paceibacterota bacterium]
MALSRQEIATAILQRRTAEHGVFPSREDTIHRLADEQRLIFYSGYDPTGPNIHIGHSVSLLLMKALARDLGHEIIVLFGDFTARIGDPTGKEAARRMLTEDEIEENVRTWDTQIATLFGDVPYTIRRNSEWLDSMTFADVIKLSATVTVQQMLARDMFQERLKQSKPIHLNEFLYPLAQGYDSVAMRVDGEVGGNDQIFNMLVGREFERELLGKEKIVLGTPLIVDAKSGKKMSKSEGELIAVDDSPQEIRRKILAQDDSMIETMFRLCTEVPEETIDVSDPRRAKEELAAELIRMYHGEEAVSEASEAVAITVTGQLDEVLKEAGLARSMTEAKTLISQGAISVNGEVQKKWDHEVKKGDEIKVGKGRRVKVA